MNKKLKYLQDIQRHVDQREFLIAQKKLLRYQSFFKFKEGDNEAVLYYSILFQIGSYKLFHKLILPSLDFKILSSEKSNHELNFKKIILAHILAGQGAYKTAQFVLNRIQNPTEGLLVTKFLHSVYTYNWELEKSRLSLENYRIHIENNKRGMMLYYCGRTVLDILANNALETRLSLESLIPLAEHGGRFHADFIRFAEFSLATMEGRLDEKGFAHAESMNEQIVGERLKLTIKVSQLRYLFLLNDADKIFDFIDSVYRMMKEEGLRSAFFDLFLKREFHIEKYKDFKNTNFLLQLNILSRNTDQHSCIEWRKDHVLAINYFSNRTSGTQLDLVAGVMATPEGIFLLTELQRRCLYGMVVNGDLGVSWLRLSELMYDEGDSLGTSFESIRKVVDYLRKMKINMSNKLGCYYFHNNFDSILFTSELKCGDQLLYLKRFLGDSAFSAEDVSRLLGLKKSRTSEYLRKWVEEKRLSIIHNVGNQKKYQIFGEGF